MSELHITAGACSLLAGPWPPAWAGSVLWCHGVPVATLRDAAPCPAQACLLQPLGGSSFCLPGGQLPLFPALPAQLRTLPCFCHLSPPGAICHSVFRQSWGKGEEKASRSQMEQVGNSHPERQSSAWSATWHLGCIHLSRNG